MKPRPGHGASGRLVPVQVQHALILGILAVTTVGAVPTSVLASAKDTNANHDGSNSASIHQQSSSAVPEARNQISVPQKRGVNPLLYNDFEYSGNSIPHGGQWEDELLDQGPLSAAALYPSFGGGHDGASSGSRLRNYDLLASLLGPAPPPSQIFYDGPVTPSVSYPYGYYGGMGGGDRSKRMANFGQAKTRQRSMSGNSRLKRSPGKLTAADALSLLAILDFRDPYSDYFPVAANGPNDVLPYSPSSAGATASFQDIPLSLALAQLTAERNNVGPLLSPYGLDRGDGNGDDGDADGGGGQWMNTWTEPAVDYLGFPMDVGLSRLDGGYGGGKPSKIGFTPQKRFMVSKRKRSVGGQKQQQQHQDDDHSSSSNSKDDDDESCKSDKKTCLLRKYGQLAAAKVAPA